MFLDIIVAQVTFEKYSMMELIILSHCAGMPNGARARLLEEGQRRKKAASEVLPSVPEPVVFTAKHCLPVLDDYGVLEFSEEYWAKWVKKSFVDYDQVESWVDWTNCWI